MEKRSIDVLRRLSVKIPSVRTVVASLSGGRFRIGHDRPEAAGCYDITVPLSAPSSWSWSNCAFTMAV